MIVGKPMMMRSAGWVGSAVATRVGVGVTFGHGLLTITETLVAPDTTVRVLDASALPPATLVANCPPTILTSCWGFPFE